MIDTRTNRRLFGVSTASYAIGVITGIVLWYVVDAQQMAGTQLTTTTGFAVGEEVTVPSLVSNNLRVTGYILSGAITFGAGALWTLFYNGLAQSSLVLSFQLDPFEAFLFMAPHGVFEMIAYLLAGTASLRIPYEFSRVLLGRESIPGPRKVLFDVLVLVTVSVLLLAIGAVVEAEVTPVLVDQVLNG